jgi:hypothetical protein
MKEISVVVSNLDTSDINGEIISKDGISFYLPLPVIMFNEDTRKVGTATSMSIVNNKLIARLTLFDPPPLIEKLIPTISGKTISKKGKIITNCRIDKISLESNSKEDVKSIENQLKEG